MAGPYHKHYLKEWRDHLEINQDRASDGLGWSQSKISRIENFHIPLTVNDLYAAAAYYGRSPWELLEVNPIKEREVIDAIDLFNAANDDQKRQIADFARFLITGSK